MPSDPGLWRHATRRKRGRAAIYGAVLAVATATTAFAGSSLWDGKVHPPQYSGDMFPPWQHGQNNDTVDKGFVFTVPEVDDMADFHGNLDDLRLVLYIGGNYYFAVAPLVRAFEKENPQYAGGVFAVTIPPGLLVKAIRAGGVFTTGNMSFTVRPDAFLAGLKKVKALIAEGLLSGPPVAYVTNNLTIMIPQGNPGHITGIKDFTRPGITVVMPNPAFEGIGWQIEATLKKAGGEALEQTVYHTDVKDGRTILTHIHHRQTPLFLMQGLADAGITWKSEAVFQEEIGHPIDNVDLPAKYNTTAIYAGAMLKGAAHPAAAKAWLAFIRSKPALRIFERYGFKPYER